MMQRRTLFAALAALALAGCASLPQRDPVQVTVAGIEGLPGEGMEVRLLVKLRVQNPNESPIEYTGAYLKFAVLDKTFATGVSSEAGTIPAFGEAIVPVPVTVSVLRMVSNVVGMLDGEPVEKVDYELSGKLSGGLFGTERFEAKGEFDLDRLDAPAPGTT
jgi:LEA14-like dessication related protein